MKVLIELYTHFLEIIQSRKSMKENTVFSVGSSEFTIQEKLPKF